MTKPSDPGTAALDRLKAAVPLKSNQSALYQWFLRNHADVAALLAAPTRPGWQEFTVELQAAGLTKANGKPLTASYVRQAWWNTRKAHARVDATSTPTPAGSAQVAPAPTPADPAARSLTVDLTADPQPADNPFGLKFAGGVKDWTKPAT